MVLSVDKGSSTRARTEYRPVTQPAEAPEKRLYTVASLGRALKNHLEKKTANIDVVGDITGLRNAESGHAYFALRDDREEASIDCVLYRSGAVRARKLLVEGAKIVVTGHITFWPPRGRVQFVVESARAEGRGALLEQLEKLKLKLASEGLFEPKRKRPLPIDPRAIGVVTSGQGAALHDIVKVAFQRGSAHLILAPAPVQGAGAAAAIVRSLTRLQQHARVDVIILGRGGGSQDDLAPFNDEALVRCVARSSIPIVSAVGHEVDTTLVDLAADVRAATPSQAAELVVADAHARRRSLDHLKQRLVHATERRLSGAAQLQDEGLADLERIMRSTLGVKKADTQELARRISLRHPSRIIRLAKRDVAHLLGRVAVSMRAKVRSRRAEPKDDLTRLERAMRTLLERERGTLAENAATIQALSPLAVLGRGFALVRTLSQGALVREAATLSVGDRLRVQFQVGDAVVRVVPNDGSEGA